MVEYVADWLHRVYHSVPSQEIHLDDGAGSGLKVRFKGFIE